MIDFQYRGHDDHPLCATRLGEGPVVVLLHAGGPDRRSLLPIGRRLASRYTVILPDVRGYGASVCVDRSRHTWQQYAEDVIALLEHVGAPQAAVGGTGLGATISLRVALHWPDRVRALVPISLEDIEDDEAKSAETAWLEAFYATARSHGLAAAWESILPMFPPVVGAMVRDAIPRADFDSIVAAGAIARDRAFRSVDDLAPITAPTLLVPGADARHPRALAEACRRIMPNARVSKAAMSATLATAEDLAEAIAPELIEFLAEHL